MQYRNLKVGERALVKELFESYYDPGIYCVEPRYFKWLHRDNLNRLAFVQPDELNILAAIDDRGLQGCICYVPGEICVQGKTYLAAFTTESLARADSGGLYGLLARRLVSKFDYTFMMGATDFLRDLYVKQLGADYSHEMRRFLLVGDLSSLQQILRLHPSSDLHDVRLFDSWARKTHEFAANKSWTVIETAAEIRDFYWQDMLGWGVGICRRDPQWLEWRYLKHPHIRYEVIAAEPEQTSGIAVVRREQVRGLESHVLRLLEFLPTAKGERALAGAVAKLAVDSGCAFLDFFCAHEAWDSRFPDAFMRLEEHLPFEIPYLLQPPEWRPRRSINLLSIRNRRRRRELPPLTDGNIYLTKGDGAQDIALNEGYRSAHLRDSTS